jgi:diguanylate cyclase (GGDEF)-like protein
LSGLSTQILRILNVGLVVLDQDYTVIIWNQQAESITGKKTAQVTGTKFTEIYPDFSLQDTDKAFSDGQQGVCPAALTRFLIPPSNLSTGVTPRLKILVDSMVADNQRYTVIQFVEEDGPAYHDPLTGLPNRILFQDRVELALVHAHRNKHSVAVLFLDMDHFKFINDTLGHAAGDQLLQELAKRLVNCLRNEDTVSRFGGDEFALLLPEIHQTNHVSVVTQKILDVLKLPWIYNKQEFYITASIGAALYPENGESIETLMKNADIAMYSAKNRGRNNYQLYDPAMSVRGSEQLAMEYNLSLALERGEFRVYYQPRMNVKTKKIVGVEALARWQHPGKGLISPAEFIPLAEATGLIVPIGEWLMQCACAQNKAWQAEGFPCMHISVNLSARQLRQPNLVEMITRVLKETCLEPCWLELEIPEIDTLQDEESTIKMLRELNEMGVRISLDNFGAGQTSLRYLSGLRINNLKIDHAIVRNITTMLDDALTATSIIALGQSLKLNVVAQGVETEEQLSFLKQQQCDEVQGYLFSKPIPASEFRDLLAKERIRIVIASDSSGYREAVETMLSKVPGIFKVVDMVSLEEIASSINDFQPRAVLCAVGDGEIPVSLLQNVKKACPNTALILITQRDDEAAAVDAVRAEVDTFLSAISPSYLAHILEIVCRGDLIMFPRSFRNQIHKMAILLELLALELPVELTSEEKEIYDLLLVSRQERD